MKRAILLGAVLGAACSGAQHGAPRNADLVLVGGDVITMDEANPHASAVAIADGRIVAVGDDLGAWVGAETKTIDLAGRTVTPGWVDGHCHLWGLGRSLENVQLRGAKSADEVAATVARAATQRQAGEWVVGRGWDQELWGGDFPSRTTLDAAVPDLPVALRRVDGHALWANSKALAIAGITRDTPDPAGGRILHDDAGEPTGVLVDNAMDLVEDLVPKPTEEVVERQIRLAAAYAAERGLVGVHEMGIDETVVAVYRRIADELPLRVRGYVEGSPEVAAGLATKTPDAPDPDAHFTLAGIKLYADGALGSRGAALREPYSDEPENTGNWRTTPEELRQAAIDATAGGWQVSVHAIGDAAIHAVLDAYEAALAEHPGDRRLRVEHVQVIAPDDVPRFAALGVIASMQPSHATSDMPWAEKRVGSERILGAYAWRTMLESGAVLVGGSDFPVEEVGALVQLYAAVTRQDADGNPAGGWYPAQRMTLEEALHAYTVAPAYAGFVEAERGQVKVGMVADLTVVDRKLAADHGLLEAKVDYTIVGGKVAFER